MRYNKDMIYKTIDLCAGIGGIRRGFEMTGMFENILAAETDEEARSTYTHLFSETPCDDIRSDNVKQKILETKYDVLLTGFPFQSFASARRARSFFDSKYPNVFRCIEEIIRDTRPKAVFIENFDKLAYTEKGENLRKILSTLEIDLNYKVIGVKKSQGGVEFKRKDFIRDSKNFGVPQSRNRVYIIAFDRNLYSEKTDLLPSAIPEYGYEVLYDKIEDVVEFGTAQPIFYLSAQLNQQQKQKNSKIISDLSAEGRISAENTVISTGEPGNEKYLIVDYRSNSDKEVLSEDCVRVLTNRERGKLLGFVNYAFLNANGNDDFSFPPFVSEMNKTRLFDQASSIPVVKRMAEFMLECFAILEKEEPVTTEIRKTSAQQISSLGELRSFVLVGREALKAKIAEIKAIDKIGAADEARKQVLSDAQDLSEALIDAEVRLGELISELPDSQGKRTDLELLDSAVQKLTKKEAIESIGLTQKTANRYEQLAAHPDIVEHMKAETRESGEIISRTAMKIAEALQARSDLNKRIGSIRERLAYNALVQDGDSPAEDPEMLRIELDTAADSLFRLIHRINITNSQTIIKADR